MHAVFLDSQGLDDLDLQPLQLAVQTLEVHSRTLPEQRLQRLQGAQIAITNKVVMDAALLRQLPQLKLICVVATGVNNIDLEAAHEQGIAVCNCQAYGTRSVAQHVLMLMLVLHTRLLDYRRDLQAGAWQAAEQFCLLTHPIEELHGRTLGIIGYGALGQEVARLARAFGMEVLVAARPGSAATPDRLPLVQLLEQVDVLSLHCPLTEDTRDLIDAAALARLRPGSFLINCARGGIVNEAALLDALRSGHLGGAAVDVLTEEPPREGNPLLDLDLPNLIVTPHCAWGSRQARSTILSQTAENIRAWRTGDTLRRV